MKEDEIDTLLMIIDATHHFKRGKYLHNLNRLSEDVKTQVEIISNVKLCGWSLSLSNIPAKNH